MTPPDAAMTPAFQGGVTANCLETHANDASDANDVVLRSQSGNGLTSDFDAVLEELAARGK
jgi:hypothetical protein